MLEINASDPIIKSYVRDLRHLKDDQGVVHELGLKGPFQTLLDKAARRRGWTLVPELSTYSGGKRVGQVVRVSVETVRIVKGLPAFR